MLVHFGVDQNLSRYLTGKKLTLGLNLKTLAKIKNKDKITAISCPNSVINSAILDYFPNLKLLITRSVGVEHIDLNACRQRKIAIYHIPDYGSYYVAQHTFALLLAAAGNIVAADKIVHQGNFYYQPFLGFSLKAKIFGIVGAGRIGLEVIKLAKAFGLKIMAFDICQNQKAAKAFGFSYVDLNKLLTTADIISLHLPLTKETKHILNKKTLALIKKGAILVNTGRGGLIDTKALIKNIKKFKAVCLDVLEDESHFSKKHPLLKFKNVIITPHCAFYSEQTLKNIAWETIKNYQRFTNNDRTNRII